jgi:hypothetical protein
MPFLTQCPFCANKANVPDNAEGGIAKCPKCGSSFSIARFEEGLNALAPASSGELAALQSSPVTAGAPTPTGSKSAVAEHDDEPAPRSVFDTGAAPQYASLTGRRWLHAWGVISVFCAGEALLFASFMYLAKLTVPLCVIGIIVAIVGFFRCEPQNKAQTAWLIAGGVLSLVLLIIALAWPTFLGPTYFFGRLI